MRGGEAGFSFLEVVIAITLLGIVSTAVFASFSLGLRSYRRGIATGDMVAQSRGAFKLLERDLARMLAVETKGTSFSKGRLTVLTVEEAGKSTLFKVTYALSGGALSRSVRSGREEKGEGEPSEAAGSSSVLVDGISKGELEFLVDDQWSGEMPEQEEGKSQAVPKAVRLTLGFESDDADATFMTSFPLRGKAQQDDEQKPRK